MAIKEELNPIAVVFRSKEFEQSYRQQYLKQDMKQAWYVITASAAFIAVFMVSDYRLFGDSWSFYSLVIARSIFIFSMLLVAAKFRTIDNEKLFDTLVFVFLLFFSGLVFYINMGRPADYLSHSIADILILLVIYFLLPNRFIQQLISATIFTIGNIIIIIYFRSSHALLGNHVIIASYLMINLLGIIASRQNHISRRTQFKLYFSERKLKEEYQYALDEIITLRGIIPICSNCKQIRDDRGYWNQLEGYIQKRSLATFSHGICPKCSKKLYPEIDMPESE